MATISHDSEISDDDYEEFSEFDDYMQNLSEQEFDEEIKWVEAIAQAIQDGKNVVRNEARYYVFRM
jgi:hypothetical protein